MTDLFNPVIRTLRLHWFSVRPCFDLLNPDARTASANTFLSEDLYYTRDHSCPGFEVRRLGRRFQEERRIGQMIYRPHGFWAVYMSRVAGEDYRGLWRGLAPMRIQLNQQSNPCVRIQSTFVDTLSPELVTIRAFPNCYLFPIGWTAGIVVEATGQFSLDTCTRLVQGLRREQVFQCRDGGVVSLDMLLRGMHDTIRKEFVNSRPAQRGEEAANPYLVALPLVFDDQGSFWGDIQVPKDTLATMLAGGPLPEDKQPLITRDVRSLNLTVLNRGTFVLSARPEHDWNVPGCACSNFKNALLITMLMQKFTQNSFGHRNKIVQEMRKVVLETFRQLENFCNKTHYRRICESHSGIQRMSAEAHSQPPYIPTTIFNIGTLTGAVGVNPQFIQGIQSPGNTPQGVNMGSTFNFNAPVTNAAIGDHATFMQNLQSVSVQQLASDLTQVHNVATQRASNDTEKADAQKLGDAATEAHNGSKEKAVALLRQVGTWGWNLIKELASSMAADSLKALIGV